MPAWKYYPTSSLYFLKNFSGIELLLNPFIKEQKRPEGVESHRRRKSFEETAGKIRRQNVEEI